MSRLTGSSLDAPGSKAGRSLRRLAICTVVLSAITLLPRGAVATGVPTITTDKADYAPEQTVPITGSGFEPSTNYDIPVIRPNGSIVHGDGSFTPGWDSMTTDTNGDFLYQYKLDGIQGTYEIRAYVSPWNGDQSATPVVSKTFTDSTVKMEQCANDKVANPRLACNTTGDWISSDLNSNNSQYGEGDSVPFRLKFDTLSTSAGNTHTVTLRYGSLKGGKHAYDYLTTWNRTDTGNPCVGTSPLVTCSGPTTLPIPTDPRVTRGLDRAVGGGDDITPVPGVFTMYGGSLTSVEDTTICGTGADANTTAPETTPTPYCYDSAYTAAGQAGDGDTWITLRFSAAVANPVLVFSGHLATRLNWGNGHAASTVSGAPYHVSCDSASDTCNSGNISIQAAAVIQPARITITKSASPADNTQFSFAASPAPLANFVLQDPASPTQDFTNIKGFTTYTVAETPVSGWTLGLGTPPCTAVDANGNALTGASNQSSFSGATVSIVLAEGTSYACTFTNTHDAHLTLVKNTVGGNGTFNFTGTGAGVAAAPQITTAGGKGNPPVRTPSPPANSGRSSSRRPCQPDGRSATSRARPDRRRSASRGTTRASTEPSTQAITP